jgi:hypothetical protein
VPDGLCGEFHHFPALASHLVVDAPVLALEFLDPPGVQQDQFDDLAAHDVLEDVRVAHRRVQDQRFAEFEGRCPVVRPHGEHVVQGMVARGLDLHEALDALLLKQLERHLRAALRQHFHAGKGRGDLQRVVQRDARPRF